MQIYFSDSRHRSRHTCLFYVPRIMQLSSRDLSSIVYSSMPDCKKVEQMQRSVGEQRQRRKKSGSKEGSSARCACAWSLGRCVWLWLVVDFLTRKVTSARLVSIPCSCSDLRLYLACKLHQNAERPRILLNQYYAYGINSFDICAFIITLLRYSCSIDSLVYIFLCLCHM